MNRILAILGRALALLLIGVISFAFLLASYWDVDLLHEVSDFVTDLVTEHQGLALEFSTTHAAPAVVTHFSIEQPLDRIPEELVSGRADDAGTLGRGGGASALITPPKDENRDGLWTISAQWVELKTSLAWTAAVDVPIEQLNINNSLISLLIIFGPNGEMTVGSDITRPDGADHHDIGHACGVRVPPADRAWKDDTDRFPEMNFIMASERPEVPTETPCPAPTGE